MFTTETPQLWYPPALFNPNADDSLAQRSLLFGETTNLLQLNEVKYTWTIPAYNTMRDQYWRVEKYPVTDDIPTYRSKSMGGANTENRGWLTPDERSAFNHFISYLTFLDSIQGVNLPLLMGYFSAPEIRLVLAEHNSQEALHVQSYQFMLEGLIDDKNERNKVYYLWRTNDTLRKRCQYIAELYQNFATIRFVDSDSAKEAFFYALIANYLLEGVYFYNGFAFFYNLASRNLMPTVADIFALINRDEHIHVAIFQRIIKEAMSSKQLPYSVDKIYEMFDAAKKQECQWTMEALGKGVLGLPPESTIAYTEYLVDMRLRAIGLDPIYGQTENPYTHLERYANLSLKGENSTKSNFFEATPTNYNMASTIGGWDEI